MDHQQNQYYLGIVNDNDNYIFNNNNKITN